MDYIEKHWLQYQDAGSLESLWRIASAMNWLSPSEEVVGASALTLDRISQLDTSVRSLMGETENV